ncbi:UDP-N-acetylmuramoyl-L-alanyl-D-glutamate--2,6-diaminopimelate ligase [Propionicimonas sp.]|uniref:UDP-N-acetylmuramoyl-L-alanyl-D-glutamate--2, 6-diaminopimelate ligase n=1 Tax=Propionicimonas sp. TaxID=1955623 RepID=UPI0017E8FE8A|nr:UDP-N-acetylmuramoyl-L-alanyl-D-glutamate--2,6-diaminopimelate ligase [Propionicimonas sp.]MBU3977647.1 UDP-N-acetylmuramoyl-L-alanyl-D-glutamate--2,6-diaminopimelate ligase [Actinomycetota bacterium]MBA3021571.1 UDP-N-acetylmuramoyl-L-alanyl-D-glutamate--2,6-diaminopimelate ligase [Propionicimonas sp.]MBU3987121.1 UDP-N-acetylmuramoyl-L-alanyl-D-glutamate--2,6-diaminopimelate ligase [Actinomycetota bacterium]MBU4008942.1 UDP-N-acetylmuramoyl-L-alanyl-D-glutamate--2,6-diaminopimelate ligase 
MTATPTSLRPDHLVPVSLASLLPEAPELPISGVSLDSRNIAPGDLYVALPGASTHGARFAAQAVANGAVAVLTDAAGADIAAGLPAVVVVSPNPRAEMARLAAEVYRRPGDQLALLGVTGTTGKTSTTFLLAAGLTASGQHVGTIGTLGFRLDAETLASSRTTVTTPEAPDLQALLAYLVERGATAVAMEVSSHALALSRTDELTFDVAGFTNLGRDHLDFHADQEDYFQAKARLFRDGRARSAVINIDDEYGQRLAAEVSTRGIKLVTTGRGSAADYRVVAADPLPGGGNRLQLATPSGALEFDLGMLGDFNQRNAATAVAMLELAGVDLAAALPGLANANVPGRMQLVDLGGAAPSAVVDFAHTPESVAAALAALPPGRRLVVLGCGGDRDQAKREPMGAAAALGAAVVVVTDDNPRSEDPAKIRASVLAGARRVALVSGATVIDGGNRGDAIGLALSMAGQGDWVAVLGKGHETGQQLADRTVPFDDVTALAQEWAKLRRQ